MRADTALLIFAKAPAPGLAKTRLIPALGELDAARLAQALLRQTVHAALDSALGPVQLWATPGREDPAWRSVDLPEGLSEHEQCEGDLGQRMAEAAQIALARNTAVILIGTDCVEMSPDLLREAAAMLATRDAVIYPTADGGYALLGLRRFNLRLFEDIPWSTDAVYSRSVQRLQALQWSWWSGPLLHDVDRPEDLERVAHLRH